MKIDIKIIYLKISEIFKELAKAAAEAIRR